MRAILHQKRGLNYRKHILSEDKILVEMKTVRKIDRYEIRVDKLGWDIQYQADNTTPGKIALVVFIAIPIGLHLLLWVQHKLDYGVIVFNYVLWFALALASFLKQHQDDIYLTGGEKNLVFYRNIPSEKEVLDFIDLVRKTSKDYIKKKHLSSLASQEEGDYMATLTWLKDTEVISPEEFEEYKNDFDLRRLL